MEVPVTQSAPDRLLHRVKSEFVEMPGLSLTEAQAARMWQLPQDEAARLLHRLVDARFLVRERDRYCRLSVV
jgi:hypothetical protein